MAKTKSRRSLPIKVQLQAVAREVEAARNRIHNLIFDLDIDPVTGDDKKLALPISTGILCLSAALDSVRDDLNNLDQHCGRGPGRFHTSRSNQRHGSLRS